MKRESKAVKISSITFPRSYSLRDTGITQSLMCSYMKCPRCFLLGLNGWQNPGKGRKTGFGSMFHDMLDKVYSYHMKTGKIPSKKRVRKWLLAYVRANAKTTLSGKSRTDLVLDQAKAYVLLTEYVRHYKRDFTHKKFTDVERVFDVQFAGARLRGKKDGRFALIKQNGKASQWIMETKTKSKINEEEITLHLAIDFQNLFYITADELEFGTPVKGVLYNIIRYPGHRLSGDTIIDFQKRLRAEVRKNPGHFFMRFEVPYDKEDKAQFKAELREHFRLINRLLAGKDKVLRRQTSCMGRYACDYMLACAGGNLSGYTKTGELFSELKA